MSGRRPPARPRPLTCILINQGAFPGLGSIMIGRRVGWIQAALMLAGFVLSMSFGVWYLMCAVQLWQNPAWSEAEFAARYRPALWSLRWGLGLCGVAWLWALVTSIGIWRQRESPL